MNSILQCLVQTPALTEYFMEKRYRRDLNRANPLGWQGKVAEEYGELVSEMWGGQYQVVAPKVLKQVVGEFQPRFSGYQQQDSSEFLSFLLDGLHEDLNRVHKKPVTQPVESNGRKDEVVAKEAWERHLQRNKSVIVDLCQGQFKSTVVCPECLTGDHRVLTRGGWLAIAQVRVGDEVLSFNLRTHHQEWKAVTGVTSHGVDAQNEADQLYRMQGSGMDIIATGNHRMLLARLDPKCKDGLQRGTSVGYETVEELLPGPHRTYSDIQGSRAKATAWPNSTMRSVVCAGVPPAQPNLKVVIPGLERVCDWWWEIDGQLAFLQFVGFWLRDGSLDLRDGYVVIGQKKESAKDWLEILLDQVFPRWWRDHPQPSRPGFVVYSIRCPPLYEYLRLMAIGPVGYNPRDPTQLRCYPDFKKAAGLAVKEQKSEYCQVFNSSGSISTWTEAEMLERMRLVSGDRVCRQCECGERIWSDSRKHLASSFDAHSFTCTMAIRQESADNKGEAGDVEVTRESHGGELTPASTTRSLRSSESTSTELSFSFDESMDLTTEAWEDEGTAVVAEALKEAATEVEEEVAVDEDDLPEVQEVVDEKGNTVRISCGTATQDEEVAAKWEGAGKTVWWNNGWWTIIGGHWYHLKRWLGNQQQIKEVYSRLSRQQAVALLEGFCRADGHSTSIQFDEGEPTGRWVCSNSSFPLIEQMQLLGHLAGAAVQLSLAVKAGHSRNIDGRTATFSVDHWMLYFTFTQTVGRTFKTTPLVQPVDVSNDTAGRGYYQHEDDGRVYCITVDSDGDTNANFLTERLCYHRLSSGRVGVQAMSVFVGNCRKSSITFDPFLFLQLPIQQQTHSYRDIHYVPSASTAKLLSPPVNAPVVVTLQLQKHYTVADMKAALSVAVGVTLNPATLLLTELYENKILKAFTQDMAVLDRVKAPDLLCMYELDELAENRPNTPERWTTLQVLQYVSQHGPGGKVKLVGMPTVVAVPTHLLNSMPIRELYERVAASRDVLLLEKQHGPDADGMDVESNTAANGIVASDNGTHADSRNGNPSEFDMLLMDRQARVIQCDIPYPRADTDLLEIDLMRKGEGHNGMTFACIHPSSFPYQSKFYSPHSTAPSSSASSSASSLLPSTSRKNLDIYSCVNAFTKEEVLRKSESWYCSNCKAHQQATKRIDLWRTPDILVLHLKRFSFTSTYRDKLDMRVDFPIEGLDLSAFVKGSSDETQLYDLYAVSNHCQPYYTLLQSNTAVAALCHIPVLRSRARAHSDLSCSMSCVLRRRRSGWWTLHGVRQEPEERPVVQPGRLQRQPGAPQPGRHGGSLRAFLQAERHDSRRCRWSGRTGQWS